MTGYPLHPSPRVVDRRTFLGRITTPALGVAAWASLQPVFGSRTLAAVREMASDRAPAAQAASDERFWFQLQQSFTVDRSLINLNNGGVSPSPAIVQQAMKRHLDYSNEAPTYTMWRVLEPQREGVRQRLGRFFGCDPEEIALTRNASEGLQICQMGFDLARGDEVLTTSQDYGRMVNTFKQRERREGIVLRQFDVPVPCEDPNLIVRRFEENITPKTRLILMCHVINLTGQVLPVRDVVRMARKRGIPVIVDGAHSFAHLAFRRDDLDCDYFATSLHKYLFAPHGTGLLHVRREKIKGLWPLQAAAAEQESDIRKYEEIGTHPAANYLAIGEALTLHLGIGSERKEARLRYLRDYWARRLMRQDRVRLHTSLRRGFSSGLGTVEIDGVDAVELAEHLWKTHRIIAVGIKHEQFQGLRVSASVYTTLEELDRFCDAMERVCRDGLPAA